MRENEIVEDDEELYRNVHGDPQFDEYYYDVEGKLIFQRAAFNDTDKKPSVDRAKMVGDNPSDALLNPTNGIVSLLAKDVRAITGVKTTVENETTVHAVDVVYDPECERLAHSIITVKPEYPKVGNQQKKAFRRLRTALARLATQNGKWTVQPKLE